MKTVTAFLASILIAAVSSAQNSTPDNLGETRLVLDVGNGIRFVPPSHVTVPVGERLTINGPSFGGRPVQWLKNNQPIIGATTTSLVIPGVALSDVGTYVLVNNEPNVSSFPSQALILSVGPTERFVNLATRGWVGGADQTFAAGFVVRGSNPTAAKKVILRAIGPSLAQFSVVNVLQQPVLKIYDSSGKLYSGAYVYAAVAGGLMPETDLADSLARVGAFPIPAGTKDVTELRPFAPGSYTAVVTGANGTSGNVLLEIYEVP